MIAGNAAFRTLILAVALLAASPASASLERDLLARWYAVLGQADASAIGGLMARNARVQLVDLGLTQNKQEFLNSMAEFGEAIKGGSIRYRVEQVSANAAEALVCYHFTSNEVLSRERFTFVRGLVSASVQRQVASDCNDFPQ